MGLAMVSLTMIPNPSSRLTRFVTCPWCATRLAVPASHPAGTQVRCGACAEVFRAPGPQLGAMPDEAARRPTEADSVPDTASEVSGRARATDVAALRRRFGAS